MLDRRTLRQLSFALLLFGSFGLYLNTQGPSLVPYRDAGEMSTTVSRLGILHPPGYPLYTLAGHLFTRLPFANPAYRLTLLSSVSMALAWGLLFLLGAELWGSAAATLTVLLGVVSFQFWMHALVSEMYASNLLVIVTLLWLLHRRRLEVAAFLFGLGLGIRMDLILCAPAFAILFWGRCRSDERGLRIGRSTVWCLLGASIFLYLWIRANDQPIPNWADPSTFDRFLASIMRRSYGSGLDLLSQSYRMGENFLSQFRLYGRHLGRDFSLLSFPLAVLGLAHDWRSDRVRFWAITLGWLCAGPLFIFLGNLPPNPHAVAIMEAAYLIADVFYLLMVGSGLSFLTQVGPAFIVAACLLGILIVAQLNRFYPAISKRHNFVAVDFIRNVFSSVPEPSMIVARSDVPVFALFYGHWIHPGARWRVPIAQGLTPSAWYPVMMARDVPRLTIGPMQSTEGWETVAQANPGWSLYGTLDTDWPPELYPRMVPAGLLLQLKPRGQSAILASDVLLTDLAIYRGRYRYDTYYEFFTPELVEEYAKAWMEWGKLLVRSRQSREAEEAFRHALALKPDMPYAAFQLGYLYFERNQFERADYYYHWAVENFRRMEVQSAAWKTFAEVRTGILRDEAQAMAHWGVIQERLGHTDRAIALYQRALKVDPASADARYNLSVIYWRQERWPDVIEQLQALSQSHPEDPRWRVYLPKAMEHLKR